jgi:tRNA G18 (ribose-2'-O)-methylase SpoU
MEDRLDPDLVANGDPRNVIDSYKTWTVEAIKADMRTKAFPIHIAIENYQHDYNIGTIVRNANAFNVASVHIIGRKHWNRRGAMATEKYLEVHHHTDISSFIAWVNEQKLPIIGIDNVATSVPLHGVTLPEACVVVFGQEGPGLSEEMQAHCKTIVAIEQFGSTRSINVGVAAGIILYSWAQTWRL